MLSNITTLCFAGSYAVTLALEASRLLFKSGVRGVVMIGFAAAGLFAHTAYLVTQAAQPNGPPLSSASDWCLMAAWVLAAAYLYLVLNHPRDLIGLFVLPLVLALIGAAQFADPQPLAADSAQRVWSLLHGVFLLAGTVAVLVGFMSGVMYLVQAWRLKHKVVPSEGLRLPSLEWLDGVNARAIRLSTLLMGLGFVSGLVLGRVRVRPVGASGVNWSDPLVWSLAAMLAWLLAASLFTLVYRPARHGRKVAYLTVASMVFLLVLLGTLLFRDTVHKTEAGSAARTTRSGAPRTGGPAVQTIPSPPTIEAACIARLEASRDPSRIEPGASVRTADATGREGRA
jgi:ABC-type uncharacterized transport system permease subunit